jgi:ABC-type glycerol-3-phosphate transport system permease component
MSIASPTTPESAASKSASGSWKLRQKLHKTAVYLTLIALSIIFMAPLMWMFSTSLKQSWEVVQRPPIWIPSELMWNNYWEGWTALPFNTFFRNSLMIALHNVFANLITCSLAAFAFARLRAPGRNVFFIAILATMMMPFEVTIIPHYLLWMHIGNFTREHFGFVAGINTFYPMMVPAWFTWPFGVFLLRQFFLTIPNELDDAARIDGASSFRIYWNIVLPLAKPALASVAILAFMGNWNNFIQPLIFLNDWDHFTIPVGLNFFRGQYRTYFEQMMAVSLITIVPILIMFFFTQRYFIRGIALTGIKG